MLWVAKDVTAIEERQGTKMAIKDKYVCHCGRTVVVHKGLNSDGSDFTRGLCYYCDSVRCDALPGACKYNPKKEREMATSKKLYEDLAEDLAEELHDWIVNDFNTFAPTASVSNLVNRINDVLEKDNPRFDRDKFWAAVWREE